MVSLSDIVAVMRTRSREVKEAFGGRPDGVENMLDIWADRIEAAAKRVVVSKTETTTVGNAAATREALEAAHQFVYTACRQNIDVMVKDKHGERVVKSKDVLYKIYSALSAPARQCDVGTAEEQFDRFAKHCIGKDCDSCEHGNRGRSHAHCALVWAQTPYAEEGAGK